MNCNDTRRLVDAWLDHELDAAPAAALAAHIDGCGACSRRVAARRALKGAVRSAVRRHGAPEGLATRVTAALAAEAAAGARVVADPRPATAQPLRHPAFDFGRPWALAAAILLSVALSSSITAFFTLPGANDPLANELVSSHIRSLMADHLTDVTSTDQHTVKPWFDGRIDFAPPVDDLKAEGYPLLGGRLDYVEERPAAALVYGHRKHRINLFVLAAPEKAAPAPGGAAFETRAERGYNLVHWRRGELSLWAVSDLDMTELRQFAELFERTATTPVPVPKQ